MRVAGLRPAERGRPRWRCRALSCLLTLIATTATAQEDLRERLTEREDQRRLAEPFSVEVAGRPLVVSGEYEVTLDRLLGPGSEPRIDSLLLQNALEGEAFYSFGPGLSLFAQLRVGRGKEFGPASCVDPCELIVERGETWFHSHRVGGAPLDFDGGRIHFEDERRWWWDAELDALRVTYETPVFGVALAAAREIAPSRHDRDHVEAEDEGVLRLIGEASWDWQRNHALELFLLHQDDRSPPSFAGSIVDAGRQDGSDARLSWFGARTIGVFQLPARSLLGYWLDTALVRGSETLVEYQALTPGQSVVTGLSRHDVTGWAVDLGVNWILPRSLAPRVFAGYALGSGDSTLSGQTDRSFRQSGLQANESGFGGVRRFASYGVLLDPELSNLEVITLGTGLSLLHSSSLDLVVHRYRLEEPATGLRAAGVEAALTGSDTDVGHEVDLVLALEEWKRVEFELVGSAFRHGRAFGAAEGERSYRAFVGIRVAF
jgi:hypothetical protein